MKTNIVIFTIMAVMVLGIVAIQWNAYLTTNCDKLGMKLAYRIGCIAK